MAAGLGFKDFATGEVLTAADVDGYLMQGIWVFASTAARDAAVTAPAEGNFAFTKDTNSLWYYDGAAWVASGATGDIEGVTAGVGISGGGTSGTVTVTNSMATAIDAKGDLIAGTGADTFARLAVGGTNGHTLQVDSSTATGLAWAAPAGGGGMTLINTGGTTLTGSSVTIDTIPGTYKNLQLVIVNPKPSADGAYLRVRINGDANTRYKDFSDGLAENLSFSENTIYLTGQTDNTDAQGLCYANFYDYANSTTWKLLEYAGISNYSADSAKLNGRSGHWAYNQTGAITSLVISWFDTNCNGGTAYLYGVK